MRYSARSGKGDGGRHDLLDQVSGGQNPLGQRRRQLMPDKPSAAGGRIPVRTSGTPLAENRGRAMRTERMMASTVAG